MIVFSYIRSFFHWLAYVFLLVTGVSWAMLRKSIQPSFSIHHFFLEYSLWFQRFSLCKIHVHGKENIDPNQSYIVMFNHFNFFDHFFLYGLLGIKMTGLEKEQHMKIPVYARFMKIAGIIPIPQRGNTEKALEGIKRAKEKMNEGYSILIAPEGTRARDGKLGHFKKGGFYMAIQTQSPILPVVYDKGMYRFCHRNRFLLVPSEIHLTILPPIPTKGLTEKDANRLKEELYQTYLGMVGESYQ